MNERREPTSEQRKVAEAPLAGPHLVDAGAGTGKTFTLVERATRLVLDGDGAGRLQPSQLLVVTFTNKAAAEIAERLTQAFRAQRVDDVPTCSTFHALGSAILREFSLSSGLSPDLRTVSNERARAIFSRAFDELLQGRLGADLSALPLLERLDDFELSLAQVALRLRDSGVGVADFEARALAAADRLAQQSWGQLWRPHKNRPDKRVDTEPKEERSLLERAQESERERRNVRAVAAAFRRFAELLESESLVTYGDLLARAVALIRDDARVAAALRARWRHALVDEFQDTNPLQLELLRAIFGAGLEPVMAVGDIRQSIYAFNGAEPQGMRDFGALPGCAQHALVENRRSVAQILEAAHAFLASHPDPLGPCAAPLRAQKGPAATFPIRVHCFEGRDLNEARRSEAAAVADEVDRLIAGGARPSECAVLLRGWRRARLYVEALHARGISAKAHGGVGFFDAAEVRDALAWLRLIVDPTDAEATVRVLQSPVCGLSDGTLVALVRGADELARAVWLAAPPAWLSSAEALRLERVRGTLHGLGHAAALPLSRAMSAIVEATGLDLAYAAIDPAGIEQTRANLAKLVRLALTFEADRPAARALDFVGELDERLAFDDDEREAELGGDEVAVMTVHAAKGLEWDNVFIANVSKSSFPAAGGGGFAPAAQWDPATGALALRYGVDGRMPLRWSMRKPHDPRSGERGPRSDSGKDEEARLFYVAMTRAKSRLYVSGVRTAQGESTFLTAVAAWAQERGVAPEELAFRSRVSAARNGAQVALPLGSPARNGAQLALPLGSAARDGLACERLGRALLRERELRKPAPQQPEQVLSYSAIGAYRLCPRSARYRYLLRLPDLRDEAATPLWTAEGDDPCFEKLQPAAFGTLVHRALELVALARIDGRPPDLDASVAQALAEEERDGDDALRARLAATVRAGAAALAAFAPRAAEWRFDADVAGQRVMGYIDLIADDAAAHPVVIDYKTGQAPDDAFRLQLTLYRRALLGRFGAGLRTALLRLSPNGAEYAELEPYDDATLEEAVRAAARLDDDTPHPGPHCRTCAYAGPLCPEGLALASRFDC